MPVQIERIEPTIQLDSGLIIPANAAAGRVLTSNASGEAAWAGTSWKAPVAYATTEALAGEPEIVGATLLSKKEEKLKVDSHEPTAGQRILVKNQAEAKSDGIYTVVKAGKAGEKWELARTSDAETAAELQNATLMVEKGTVNEGTEWFQIATIVTLGTTAQEWVGSLGGAVTTITATEKWKKPGWAFYVTVIVYGGGGGGGSGAHVANGKEAGGGGAGAGAAIAIYTFPAAALPSEVECTIGKGGTGGASTTTEAEAGKEGKAGETSHFGELLYASGGKSGLGGKETSEGAGGSITSTAGTGAGGEGGNGGIKTTAGFEPPVPPAVYQTGGGGGGGGGGCSTTAATAGGKGGYGRLGPQLRAEGGAVGEAGKEGGEGLALSGIPGRGGGGGGGGFSVAAGNGGKGGKYGGGGGGGGACSKAGGKTGEGGAGGNGAIVVIAR